MAFLNRETGELTFADGLQLSSGLAIGEVAQRLNGALDGRVCLSSHSVAGGRLVPVCTVEGGSLQSIVLCVSSVGGKAGVPARRQRAFLFARLGLRDPFPDTLEPVRVRCPFGELIVAADPHTGRTEARVMYAAR